MMILNVDILEEQKKKTKQLIEFIWKDIEKEDV